MFDELNYHAARVARGLMSRRAFMGRAAALGATAAIADTLLSTAAYAAGPNRGGTLTMGLNGGGSTDTLDPALATSWLHMVYLATMGNYLVTLSPQGELLPSLALSWEASPDAKTWYFKIRNDVKFHDGRTLSADDVRLTISRHSDRDSSSGAFGVLTNIADTAVNGDDFVVTLHSADAEFPYVMTDYHLVIQPGGGIDDPASGVFTGAYKLKSFEPGVRLLAEKFDDHWDTTVGHFAEVSMVAINDNTARNSALQSGQAQIINQIEPNLANLIKQMPDIAIPSVSGRGMYAFNMFCDTAPFDNNDLRMAMKLAINREEMLAKILDGYGTVGNDMPVGPAYPLFDSSIPQREYDPEQAAYYYKKSGHSGEIVLRSAGVAFPGAVEAAELFQQTAKEAGIDIKVQREPDDGYWDTVWNAQPFSATYWAGRSTQGQMYTTNYLSSSVWNDTRFMVPQFDAWIEEAQAELDEEKRKEIYSEAGLYMRDNGGLINPMFNDFIDGYRTDKVAGWEDNPNGAMMNCLAAIKCWQA